MSFIKNIDINFMSSSSSSPTQTHWRIEGNHGSTPTTSSASASASQASQASSLRRLLHIKNQLFDVSKTTDDEDKQTQKKKKKKKKQSEYYRVVKVTGDGRCMFRSLAIGLAHVRNENIGAKEERVEADRLREAVLEQMCKSDLKRNAHPEASMAIKYENGGIGEYCKRIQREDFWGGETELLVIAKLIQRPIMVYLPARIAKNASSSSGYVCIQTYGEEFRERKSKKTGKMIERAPVRLLYNGETHYDLLI